MPEEIPAVKVTRHLGSVAQLVERSTENRKVTGSTPVGATTGKHQFFENWCFSSLTPSPYLHRLLRNCPSDGPKGQLRSNRRGPLPWITHGFCSQRGRLRHLDADWATRAVSPPLALVRCLAINSSILVFEKLPPPEVYPGVAALAVVNLVAHCSWPAQSYRTMYMS